MTASHSCLTRKCSCALFLFPLVSYGGELGMSGVVEIEDSPPPTEIPTPVEELPPPDLELQAGGEVAAILVVELPQVKPEFQVDGVEAGVGQRVQLELLGGVTGQLGHVGVVELLPLRGPQLVEMPPRSK
eukprot:2082539-Amphidinium_carterae.1